MSSDHVEVIRIKELNLEIIPPSTERAKEPKQGSAKIVVIGKPGCFAMNTPVLMHDGQIKMIQDVRVGDVVMGPDSQPRNVLELCRNVDEMYTVVPMQGISYTVNRQHILVLKQGEKEIEITVEQFLSQPEEWQQSWSVFRTAIEFPYQAIYQDPYKFGRNIIANNKTIPVQYKLNTNWVRLELLAGLLDQSARLFSDHLALLGSNEYMIDDIAFVARSVGLVATKIKDEGSFLLRLYGNLAKIPCRIHSKLPATEQLTSKFRLMPMGIDQYYGFVLDGDHRFVLGSFDVCHNTGKTTLISSLLYAKKHIFPVAMVMSGTEDTNHFYSSVIPSTFVFNSYDEEQIKKFIQRQRFAMEHVPVPWAVMILDDCTDDPKVFRKPLQQGIYKRGRHWKMLYILSLQYSMDVPPSIRTNIDGVFILREPNLRNRKVMYENYAAIIPDFRLFCDILDQITDDFTALYIHNATKTNDWRDCIFWYKAKEPPKDFKFGCPTFWDHHYQRYNPEYVDPVVI